MTAEMSARLVRAGPPAALRPAWQTCRSWT